jgi:hypothetical protein
MPIRQPSVLSFHVYATHGQSAPLFIAKETGRQMHLA